MDSELRLYSYSACSTCRKAIAWLRDHNLQHEIVDIVKNPPPRELLSEAIVQLGDRKYLFNTSGKSYRAIGSSAVKSMSEEQVLDALVSDGKLIKRPLLITGRGQILVGFKLVYWAEVLLN